MKKLIMLCVFTVLLYSCKSQSVTNTKVDNKVERMMKGNWTITSVDFTGSEVMTVNSFEIADSKCFEGSTWKFISNNNKGEMMLNNVSASCPSFSSPISWFVNKEGQFVIKILDAGVKAKKARDGYVLDMGTMTENSFQLIDRVMIGGKSTAVVYQFQKQ